MSDIYDLSTEMNRLCPSQVDDSISGNGQREAGHKGHDGDGDRWPCVGWFCAGGNAGHPVFEIHPADIDAAHQRLKALEDGALDRSGIDRVFAGLRVNLLV